MSNFYKKYIISHDIEYVHIESVENEILNRIDKFLTKYQLDKYIIKINLGKRHINCVTRIRPAGHIHLLTFVIELSVRYTNKDIPISVVNSPYGFGKEELEDVTNSRYYSKRQIIEKFITGK